MNARKRERRRLGGGHHVHCLSVVRGTVRWAPAPPPHRHCHCATRITTFSKTDFEGTAAALTTTTTTTLIPRTLGDYTPCTRTADRLTSCTMRAAFNRLYSKYDAAYLKNPIREYTATTITTNASAVDERRDARVPPSIDARFYAT